MAFQDGENLVLKIGDGATPTENFTSIGGLTKTSFTLKNTIIESNDLASGQWRVILGEKGVNSLAISASGYFTDTAAEEVLRGKAFSGSVNNFELHFGNGDVLSGSFYIDEYNRNGINKQLEEFAISILNSGEVSFIAA